MAKRSNYVQPNGNGYRVRLVVPPHLQSIVGRKVLTKQIPNAGSHAEALRNSYGIVAELQQTIARAEHLNGVSDPLEREALRLREFIKVPLQSVERHISSEPATEEEWLNSVSDDDEGYALIHRVRQIRKGEGELQAQRFSDIASHAVTPLEHHAGTFLKSKAYRQKSEADFLRALAKLREWLASTGLPLTIETVNRKTAHDFIWQRLAVGRGLKKARAYKGFLSQYWDWLEQGGYIPFGTSPWDRQSFPRVAQPKPLVEEHDGGKRPFTDAELVTLLSASASQRLLDLKRLSALSGMRLEEVCQLTVADCQNNVFRIRQGKTENAQRKIPIHPTLAELVATRCEGKPPSAFLIHELPAVPASRQTRSDPVGKAFTRHRRALGIDERPNGKAKSNVDFHSLRRWFAHAVREARRDGKAPGTDETTLKAIMGHARSDITEHTYAGDEPLIRLRTLIASIDLPK